jgi:hypothetical protein
MEYDEEAPEVFENDHRLSSRREANDRDRSVAQLVDPDTTRNLNQANSHAVKTEHRRRSSSKNNK